MHAQYAEKRKSLRQVFRRKRMAISETDHAKYALQIVDICKQHTIFSQASPGQGRHSPLVKRVALYLSFDGELNTQALITYLWSQNIDVYLPVLHPFSKGHLLFLRYTTNTKLVNNRFGIAEPVLDVQNVCPLMQLDIVFTPLVAFDTQGNRLGMGGGFYDRTLASLLPKPTCTQASKGNADTTQKPRVIGLALPEQESNALPTEVWDIPLPQIITPARIYNFN